MNYEIKNNQIVVNDCKDEETVNYITTTIYALNGSIEHVSWQSKYNNYVIYDHEPFCADGFKFVIALKEGNVHNEFILFHLTQQLNSVEHLEKCLSISD